MQDRWKWLQVSHIQVWLKWPSNLWKIWHCQYVIRLFVLYLSLQYLFLDNRLHQDRRDFFRQLHGQHKLWDALQSLMQWSSQPDALGSGRTVPRFPCSLISMPCNQTLPAMLLTCFYLTFSLLKNCWFKKQPFWLCVNYGGEQITSQWVKTHHLQYLILVQLHSREGIIVFSPNSRDLYFVCWHGHGRHCIWWLRGLILGSWFASFASEL